MKKFIRPKAASELLGIPLSSLYDKIDGGPFLPEANPLRRARGRV